MKSLVPLPILFAVSAGLVALTFLGLYAHSVQTRSLQVGAQSALTVFQGGTGSSSPSGILYGDNGATPRLSTVTIGSNLTFSGGTLSASGGGSGFSTTSADYWISATNTLPSLTTLVNLGAIKSSLSGLLEANAGVLYSQATSTLSASSPLTGSFTQVGSGGALGCTTAASGVAGCLSNTAFDTFNNKQAAIGVTFPITLTGVTVGFGGLTTSTAPTQGQLPYWSGVNTFASVATSALTASAPLSLSQPISIIGAAASALTISTAGTWSGNAGTATALAADGANCSAGNFPLGVDTLGAVQTCTDAWTEAENTAAAYAAQATTLTIAGTSNQITSSAGAQSLAANRTWTLSLPQALQFPLSFTSTYGTTTYASSTVLTATALYSTNATTTNLSVTSSSTLATLFGAGLGTCNSGNVLTWAAGIFGCAADQTSTGAANPFTWGTNYNVIMAATTSAIWAKTGVYASSTVAFGSGGNLFSYWDNTNNRQGYGTTSPWALLSINPDAAQNTNPSFVVGSSTATSFLITNSGRVALGTSTPTNGGCSFELLCIATNSSVSAGIGFSSGANSNAVLGFIDTASSVDLELGTANNFPLDLITNSNVRIDIKGSGQIGLSSSTPSSLWGVSIGTSTAVSNGQFAQHISSSTSQQAIYTIDWENENSQLNQAGNMARILLNQNTTIILNATSSHPIDGGKYSVILCQDGTGSRTVTWATPGQLIWWNSTTTVTTAANSSTWIGWVYQARVARYTAVASSTVQDARACNP